jgi:hypothetical protein
MKIALKKLVSQFLNSADESVHGFRRLYNIGVQGCREFNLDITGNIKTVVLDVNANKTANLPQDYISYSKIGVLNNKGEVVTYKRNDQLSTWNSIYTSQDLRKEGAPVLNTLTPFFDQNTYPNYYYNYYYNGTSYNLFGADSGTPKVGSYKVDESNGLIILDVHNHYSQLVLEYMSDGYDENADDYEIDSKAEQAFMAYLRWKNAIDLRKQFSQSDVRSFKLEYYRERRLAAMRINQFVLNELADAARVGVKLSAKA